MRFDDRYYRLAIASGGRLVGRDTRVVTVRPTDSYRYGYRLWLDHATAMPLKVQIAGDDGVVVEQLLFSDISLPERIPASAVQPSVTIDSFTWQRSTARRRPSGAAAASRIVGLARRSPCRPGFSLRAVRSQRSGRRPAAAGAPRLFGWGRQPYRCSSKRASRRWSRARDRRAMGAANAYTTMTGGYLVTAVGEVPVRTVETIATRPVAAGRAGSPGAVAWCWSSSSTAAVAAISAN